MERIRKGPKKKKKSVSWKCFVNYVFFFDFVFFLFLEGREKNEGDWRVDWGLVTVICFCVFVSEGMRNGQRGRYYMPSRL